MVDLRGLAGAILSGDPALGADLGSDGLGAVHRRAAADAHDHLGAELPAHGPALADIAVGRIGLSAGEDRDLDAALAAGGELGHLRELCDVLAADDQGAGYAHAGEAGAGAGQGSAARYHARGGLVKALGVDGLRHGRTLPICELAAYGDPDVITP